MAAYGAREVVHIQEVDKDVKLFRFNKIDRSPENMQPPVKATSLFGWKVRISSCRHVHAVSAGDIDKGHGRVCGAQAVVHMLDGRWTQDDGNGCANRR